jgi:hypothetical protein
MVKSYDERKVNIVPMEDRSAGTYAVTIEDYYDEERLSTDKVTTTLVVDYSVDTYNIVIKYLLRIDIEGASNHIHKVDTTYRYIYTDTLESLLYTQEEIIERAVNSDQELQNEIDKAYQEFIEANEFKISKSTMRVVNTAVGDKNTETEYYVRLTGRYKDDDISLESILYLPKDETRIMKCKLKFRSYMSCRKAYHRDKLITIPKNIKISENPDTTETRIFLEQLVSQGCIINTSDLLELENIIDQAS